MLCFVISKRDYDLNIERELKVEPKYVCVGSIKSVDEAQALANILPCFTEIHIIGKNINKCCYITCNV